MKKPGAVKLVVGKSTAVAILCIFLAIFANAVKADTISTQVERNKIPPPIPLVDPPSHLPIGWRFWVGAGALYAPTFAGSKDYQIVSFPNIKLEFKDLFFMSVKDGVGYNIIHADGLRVGPIVKYKFERKEDGSNPFRVVGKKTKALTGLGNVDGTLECGGFVEYSYERFAYKVELRHGVNGHKGMIGEASINYASKIIHSRPPIFFAIGPRASFADSDYINSYFGINQLQSLNSGLNRYSAGGGLVTYGVGGFMSMPLYRSVLVSVFGGYDRLSSEVADSPLISQRGSENQFATGLSVTYKFDL